VRQRDIRRIGEHEERHAPLGAELALEVEERPSELHGLGVQGCISNRLAKLGFSGRTEAPPCSPPGPSTSG
jgi:hypothetical protein